MSGLKSRGLGRGLDALLPTKAPEPTRTAGSYGSGNVFLCPVERIIPQKGQPRQHFDETKLEELAQSIREHGLIEPLVVRRIEQDRFELIAGERRWRASQRAGLHEVLVVVRELSSDEAFELAIIENIQRADLDPIEFAEAMHRLQKERGFTQEALAQRLGKDRSTVANALRLLRLPVSVRANVVNGQLSEGHARALLGLALEEEILQVADKVLRGRLSVRQTEELVRLKKMSGGGTAKSKKSASTRDLEQRLQKRLGTRCEVKDRDGKGELRIRYASLDELDRLLEILL